MLKYLDFTVVFNSTGKKYTGHHVFSTGLTSITGPNESGKSLRLEMIRYALFGSRALRDIATSYTSINVKLRFAIGDNEYLVNRNGGKVTLYDENSKPIATGTMAVNNAIIELFGYGLEVFDVSNACLQDEINSLSQKSPTERRKMIDKTLGLEAVDKVLLEVRQEITANTKSKKYLEDLIGEEVEEPTKPVGITDTSENLQTHLDYLYGRLNTKHWLEGQINVLRCEEPKIDDSILQSGEVDVNKLVEEMTCLQQKYEEDKKVLLDSINLMSNFMVKLDKYPQLTKEQLIQYHNDNYKAKWEVYNDYQKRKSQVLECNYDQSTLHRAKDELIKLENINKKLNVECPSCSHEFLVDGEGKTESKTTVDTDLLEELGVKSSYDIVRLENNLKNFMDFALIAVPDKPDLAFVNEQPEWFEDLISNKHISREDLDNSIEELKDVTSLYEIESQKLKNEVQKAIKNNQLVSDYKNSKEKYTKFIQFLSDNETELKQLNDIENYITETKDKLKVVLEYETKLNEYNSHISKKQGLQDNIDELKTKLDELNKVKDSLVDLKPKVKMYLMPSLNAVASELLSQMTNGVRNKVDIDEEFNILIDGQSINQLSGSAKAVANLSIRIGLGMVLTNKIFSVFLTDEVDAAMDNSRAEYTAEALRNLKGTINQIILVSHKDPEVDHAIRLI